MSYDIRNHNSKFLELVLLLFFCSSYLCCANGGLEPCEGVDVEIECTPGTGECGEGYSCSCGVCAPDGCEGSLEFQSGNLGQAVRYRVGKSSNEKVYYADVRTIKELDDKGSTDYFIGIQSLEGIQCLTSLRELNLSGHHVGDLVPLSNLHSMTTIYLSGSMIDNIAPIADLTELSMLDFSENNIDDISATSGLTSLSYINLTLNDITDITPLVDNSGVGEDDQVSIGRNPIDCNEQSSNIQTLRDRGVDLTIDCP